MAKIGQFLAGQRSGRPCTNLMQHSEPIFQVPGVRNAIAVEVMKLVQCDRDWLSRCLKSKDFPSVGRNHARPHTSTVWLCNHVVNHDLQVRKRSKEHLHEWLET